MEALDGAEEVLLPPDDRARPHEAQPAHGLPRREAVKPHHAEGDERPRPREARERAAAMYAAIGPAERRAGEGRRPSPGPGLGSRAPACGQR